MFLGESIGISELCINISREELIEELVWDALQETDHTNHSFVKSNGLVFEVHDPSRSV